MTFDEYQANAQRTSSTKTKPDKLLNGVMGLNGEAGECIDIVKKHLFQGHELDEDNLIDEISDVLWYCAELASGLGVSLGDIAQHNVDKLVKRYPDGFSAERSINR
jgi:NTP pyrophosphatase (non-canonical NTP hydrolase)